MSKCASINGTAYNRDDMTSEQIEFVRTFGRHCVTVSWFDKSPLILHENGGRGRHHSISGFIVSVLERWYFVTAGHVIEDIETALSRGQILAKFQVNDCWGQEAKYPPQTFDYQGSFRQQSHNPKTGEDYGFVRLDENTQARMEANGVKPLHEGAWTLRTQFDEYFICGVPALLQSTEPLPNAVKVQQNFGLFQVYKIPSPAHLMLPVKRLFFKRPDILEYVDGRCVDDIDGMSGSPIFGHDSVTGDYFVIGIQSAVDTETGKILIACWFPWLAMALTIIEESLQAQSHRS
jgi:hypothetical protein